MLTVADVVSDDFRHEECRQGQHPTGDIRLRGYMLAARLPQGGPDRTF
jgi:hypothetical protein